MPDAGLILGPKDRNPPSGAVGQSTVLIRQFPAAKKIGRRLAWFPVMIKRRRPDRSVKMASGRGQRKRQICAGREVGEIDVNHTRCIIQQTPRLIVLDQPWGLALQKARCVSGKRLNLAQAVFPLAFLDTTRPLFLRELSASRPLIDNDCSQDGSHRPDGLDPGSRRRVLNESSYITVRLEDDKERSGDNDREVQGTNYNKGRGAKHTGQAATPKAA
jgi:hypothetical protein